MLCCCSSSVQADAMAGARHPVAELLFWANLYVCSWNLLSEVQLLVRFRGGLFWLFFLHDLVFKPDYTSAWRERMYNGRKIVLKGWSGILKLLINTAFPLWRQRQLVVPQLQKRKQLLGRNDSIEHFNFVRSLVRLSPKRGDKCRVSYSLPKQSSQAEIDSFWNTSDTSESVPFER